MRSRYSAYVLDLETYLLDSWHPDTRPPSLGLDQDTAVKWIGLKIVDTESGGENDDEGIVEFIARFKVNGKAQRLHERSRFIKTVGRWFYLDGLTPE
jgi:SEC-C motif-containing protein